MRSLAFATLALLFGVCTTHAAPEPHARIKERSRGGLLNTRKTLTDAAQADRVVELPGARAEDLTFGLYSGYVTVDDDAGRALFYALAESQSQPEQDPLVLWLNGGPGCSSIGGGFFSELGPFYPTPGGKELLANHYAWNRVANVLFIESPAFVGFSYSNRTSDRYVGDYRTSHDLVVFLHRFLERFPQFNGREFWISGESYGGHYVPNLAATIIDSQQHPSDNNHGEINLKGFLVGNAWTDAAIDNGGAVDFWHSHAIVSDSTRRGIWRYCELGNVGPLRASLPAAGTTGLAAWLRDVIARLMGWARPDAEKCAKHLNRVSQEMGNINIYEILADVCLPGNNAAQQLGRHLQGTPIGAALAAQASLSTGPLKGRYDPCIDGEVEQYVNRPEVQSALHANVSGSLPGRWSDCSSFVAYNSSDLFASELPVYHKLLREAPHLQKVVFSGDVDGIVPVLGTRRWIDSLRLPITHPWRPWYSSTGQVGGYIERYEGLTFATVRNAGHMVPYTQPERGFHLFSKIIKGEAL